MRSTFVSHFIADAAVWTETAFAATLFSAWALCIGVTVNRFLRGT